MLIKVFKFIFLFLFFIKLSAQGLPKNIELALQKAKIPKENIAIYVENIDLKVKPILEWNSEVMLNPASVIKLITTFSALELLSPAYTWKTPIYLDGNINENIFYGNIYIKASGDPKLVSERLWLIFRKLQGLGINQINGNIILDNSNFQLPFHDSYKFDGKGHRPYNVGPSAFLINYGSIYLSFFPDEKSQLVRIHSDIPLIDIRIPKALALNQDKNCGNWQNKLKLDLNDNFRIQFHGSYPLVCGEQNWSIALKNQEIFIFDSLVGIWQSLGGKLLGRVRFGKIPKNLTPTWEIISPTLGEITRDINKFSNNVMASQVLLTLGLHHSGLASYETGQEIISKWWRLRWNDQIPIIENGSGLSRQARVSALGLGRMLKIAWHSKVMPDLVSSLPILGVDGTLRRKKLKINARLKTGSLEGVKSLAGFIDTKNNERLILVAIINHQNSFNGDLVFDNLITWINENN